MVWNGAHYAFTVKIFLKNGESATQIVFLFHYKLGRHDAGPVRKPIQLWVANFRATCSAFKWKPPKRPQTPDNIEAITPSPTRSACKHTLALVLSDRTVRKIPHWHTVPSIQTYDCLEVAIEKIAWQNGGGGDFSRTLYIKIFLSDSHEPITNLSNKIITLYLSTWLSIVLKLLVI